MRKVLDQVGFTGAASIALLAMALAFSAMVVAPIEQRGAELLSRPAPKAGSLQPGAKVAAVYAHLRSAEGATDWLAKLHGVALATGVQLKSANYRSQKTEGRIVRTEIALPVAGSYSQIRDFMQRASAEIPVMSIDAVSLKRAEHALQAEMRITLHMVKS
jgi:hypothetical protein